MVRDKCKKVPWSSYFAKFSLVNGSVWSFVQVFGCRVFSSLFLFNSLFPPCPLEVLLRRLSIDRYSSSLRSRVILSKERSWGLEVNGARKHMSSYSCKSSMNDFFTAFWGSLFCNLALRSFSASRNRCVFSLPSSVALSKEIRQKVRRDGVKQMQESLVSSHLVQFSHVTTLSVFGGFVFRSDSALRFKESENFCLKVQWKIMIRAICSVDV